VDTFWGLTSNGWTAVATVVQAIVTFALLIAAWVQLSALRVEAKRSRTIAAIERYDFDPVLDASVRAVREALRSGALKADPKSCESDVVSVLNFLETLAMGSDRDVYDRAMIDEFYKEIMTTHVEELLDSGIVEVIGRGPTEYTAVLKWRERLSGKTSKR
jgi:hypothetical protein